MAGPEPPLSADRLGLIRHHALVPMHHEVRRAARVVLLDDQDRVLLIKVSDPSNGNTLRVTPGGGLEAGESEVDAALRELSEEAGLSVASSEVHGPVWVRTHDFRWDGVSVRQHESYFVVRVPDHVATWNVASDAQETGYFREHRWWAVAELRTAVETFAPRSLGEHLSNLLSSGVPDSPLEVGT